MMYSEDLAVENGIIQPPFGFVQCSICHRYFGDASIRLHEKHCEMKRLREEEERAADARHKNRVIKRMPGVLCYICGRPFGRAGMVFHEPQCLAKWRRINAELPKRERRPEPTRPDNFMRPGMYNNRDVLHVDGSTQPLNVNNNPPTPHLVTPTPKPRINKRVLRRKPNGGNGASPITARENVSSNCHNSRAPTNTASSVTSIRRNSSSVSQNSRNTNSGASPAGVHRRGNSLNSPQSAQPTISSASKWLAPSM